MILVIFEGYDKIYDNIEQTFREKTSLLFWQTHFFCLFEPHFDTWFDLMSKPRTRIPWNE